MGQEGYLVLLDEKGQVLAHPNQALIGEVFSSDLVKAFLTGKTGELDYTENGDDRFAVFTTVGRTGWKLAALISYDEARVLARQQLYRTLSIGTLFLLIALVVGVVFQPVLDQPVGHLVKALRKLVRQLPNGDGSGSGDEIGPWLKPSSLKRLGYTDW